ncbi:hypothetical protein D3C81_615480 [compost metagenome]
MTPSRHRAIRVVQAAEVQRCILRRHDAAIVVPQRIRFHQRIAIALNLAASVIQQAGRIDTHQAATRLGQVAGAVVQAARVNRQLIGDGGGIAVVQGRRRDIKLAITRNLAGLVVELACVDSQDAGARVFQLAMDVRQYRGVQSQVRAVDGDAAGRVVQFSSGDDSVARARLHNVAVGVVQVGHIQLQLTGYQLALAVHQRLRVGRVGRDGQHVAGGNHGLVRHDIASICRDGDVCCARLATRKIHTGTRQRRTACRQVLPARLQHAIRIDGQVACRTQATVRFHASAQQAAAGDFARRNMAVVDGSNRSRVVQQATHRQLLVAARVQQARVVQVTAHFRRQVRAGADRALLVQQGHSIQTQIVCL